MQRALALAAPMAGRTGENPAVGCVVVKGGATIGEAATGAGGRPHAEEAALAQAGAKAQGAIVYLTLEPCNQRSGGGPSCTDLLIASGVGRVVIATGDPHPLAAGKGIERLQSVGVKVELGLCEGQARAQNAPCLERWKS